MKKKDRDAEKKNAKKKRRQLFFEWGLNILNSFLR